MALARWAGQLASVDGGLRAVGAESMHLTLCFLGERSVSEIDAIGAACAGAARAPVLELSTGGLVGFPRARPRVLAAAIEDRSRGLAQLQARLATALVEIGAYRPEPRPFTPHVTLVRARGRGSRSGSRSGSGSGSRSGSREPRPGRGHAAQRLLAPVAFTASSFTLFRSVSAPGGSVYEPLRSVFLDAPS